MATSAGAARPDADPESGRGRQRATKLSDLSDFFVTTPLLGGAAGSERTRRLPRLFERAAASWWDPRFDSDILEGQYRETTFLRIKRRLQIGVVFALLAAIVWCAYVGAFRDLLLLALLGVLGVLPLLVVLGVSETACLERHLVSVSAVAAGALCLLSLLPATARLTVFPGGHSVTELQLFTWAVVTVTLVYTMIPLPLYASVLAAGAYSVALEVLNAADADGSDTLQLGVRAGLHLCLHLIGLRTLVLAQVHMRSTFTTVGQTMLTRLQLEEEKQLKEKMIHSVMPPSLASWAQLEMHDEQALLESTSLAAELDRPQRATPAGPEICFRPFNMRPMDPVSILFADIVGFTRMSSNKTAEQLVGLLNDLFGRFDELCALHGCEKISTLGDCYYCVSGCPKPRDDHAHCCVEMGLAMITAIGQFDRDNGEDVNMRVGVHTGRVLCGLVGTARFKFDVWSNDVSMANKMESSGRPGAVHISERTYKYLHGQYQVTPGDPLADLKTYFIVGKREPFAPRSEPSSPSGRGSSATAGRLTKKACSLPSIIETPDTTRQVEPVHQTLTLDRRSRRPRLRTVRTDADLRARLCGNVRTRLTSGGFSLQPLPEERPSSAQGSHVVDLVDDDDDQYAREDRTLGLSMSSFNSRKDSGIRSRRSSIQPRQSTDLKTYFIVGKREPFAPRSEPSSPSGRGSSATAGRLTKKACSLPSIIETPDTTRQVEPVHQTLTLDRRSRRPRLRTVRTDADLRARLCGNVRTRLTSGGFSLQPLPEERPSSAIPPGTRPWCDGGACLSVPS
ncbi:adenylate cyclase type 9-like [Pollicipes pollicipes]|uniref:adenylate cyclase type 9-like n=1 Tax=Pollicipes pollicipes TaxID=41117 RepID=UPI00188580D9|nr:adenylate cyclase type 9-like [Pollicipes pollicipes]